MNRSCYVIIASQWESLDIDVSDRTRVPTKSSDSYSCLVKLGLHEIFFVTIHPQNINANWFQILEYILYQIFSGSNMLFFSFLFFTSGKDVPQSMNQNQSRVIQILNDEKIYECERRNNLPTSRGNSVNK